MKEGLSLVAGLIGHPVEADEFTIRMVSLEVSHLKVRADCTKPLPPVVELLRDDGSIIPVSVTYPWTPPSCVCCKRLGHLENRCPNAKWAPASMVPPPYSDPDTGSCSPNLNQESSSNSNPTIATPSKSRRKAKSKLNHAADLDHSASSKAAHGSVSTSF